MEYRGLQMPVLNKLIYKLAGIGLLISVFTSTSFSQTDPDLDLIIFYDIDHGSLINARPDNGWLPLNPGYPDDPKLEDGLCRTTTSLLGTYESQDSAVIRQHAYWVKALGCNVFCSDLTNVKSPVTPGEDPWMPPFYSGVIKAFELQLKELSEISDFETPVAYPALRLYESNIEDFKLMLEEADTLYQQYPDQWYYLDDGTADQDKPFITVFIGSHYYTTWAANGIPAEVKGDPFSRFNIRWTNGFFRHSSGITEYVDSSNAYKIPGNLPYWFFVENRQTSNGYYETVYKETPDGQGVEQMITWASVWLNGANWDGLRDIIDGKTPIVRYTEPVFDLMPKTLLVNRFNYPIAWPSEPQEGVSRNKSTHIEPNVDWGFEVFHEVADVLYDIRGTSKAAPPVPALKSYDVNHNRLKIELDGFPLEYRISNDENLNDALWVFLNVGQNGIELGSQIDRNEEIFIQTRNSFGESPIGSVSVTSGNSWFIIDDVSSKISYDSLWQTASLDGYYNHTLHYSLEAGAAASYEFFGTGIKLIAATHTDHGKAEVVLDGSIVDTVDFYSALETKQVVVFVDSSLFCGAHTVQILATGTNRDEATGFQINIDAFEVKQVPYNITFQVSDTSGVLEGASVKFNGSTYYTGVDGIARFTNVLPATAVNYTITKNGYETIRGTQDVVANDTVHIILKAIPPIPVDSWYTVDDTSSIISYDSNWETADWEGYYNNTVHYTWEKGATASFIFTGAGIKVIAARNSNLGKAEVYIDSSLQDTIDYYGPSETLQVVVYTDSSLSPGEHSIEIIATGTKRAESTDPYIGIDAFEVKQSAYNGMHHRIPGKLEAEDFDVGGEESAYHDTDPENLGNEYRPSEAVDIQGGTYDGGFHIGWTAPGEWLEYSIEGILPGSYNIHIDAASPVSDIGTILYVIIEDDILGAQIHVPFTGNWMDFQRITIPSVNIPAGQDKILRLFMDGGDFNLNWIEFEAITISCSTQIIDFKEIDDKYTDDQPFKLSATASSGLPVSFELLWGPASLRNDSIILTGEAGEVTVLARQDGDEAYCFAFDSIQKFEVIPAYNSVFNNSGADLGYRIIPNPNHGSFRIDRISGVADIRIYSISGSLLYQKRIDENSNVNPNLRPGIYLLEIDNIRYEVIKLVIDN